MIKKIKKWFCTIIAAFAVIYAINVIYASWSVFKTLNGNNDDEMRYYEVTSIQTADMKEYMFMQRQV